MAVCTLCTVNDGVSVGVVAVLMRSSWAVWWLRVRVVRGLDQASKPVGLVGQMRVC